MMPQIMWLIKVMCIPFYMSKLTFLPMLDDKIAKNAHILTLKAEYRGECYLRQDSKRGDTVSGNSPIDDQHCAITLWKMT